MAQMLEFSDPAPPPSSLTTSLNLEANLRGTREKVSIQNLGTPAPAYRPSTQLATAIPTLVPLLGRIFEELESNLSKLLSLNPSRRDSIVHHMEKLSGLHTTAQPPRTLQDWMAGPRSTAQNSALKTYLEEVALIALGQAILLKAWSDRGIRAWHEQDLGHLNWVLSTTLKPQIPLDREGWQITRPNLYSWYNPSRILQKEIWAALDAWRIADEGPQFLINSLKAVRRAQPEVFEAGGYDRRFFKALWEQMSAFGFDPTPENDLLKRNKVIFSPTLRDGAIVRSSPPSIQWIGLEASAFQLMFCELMQIWWGPSAPPFWSIGTGLEVHTRDQLALALGSSKTSAVSKIAEMEACDAAIVLEEQVVRSQGRNPMAGRLRELLETLPYFKKLRSPGTSLGDLQACVSLSKLRPGALFWWAREEAISSKDGAEVLHFLLDRAKLCYEWDFSEIEHSLPAGLPLYPKHLYLFQKELHVETRLSHRPIRHSISGQLRSHVELPLLLEDAFLAAFQTVQPRGNWSILSHPSPTSQREWVDKWPDPTSQTTLRQIDQLRSNSLPLASFTTIRPTPEGDNGRQGTWSVHPSLKGFWMCAEYDSEGRKLVTHPLPYPGTESHGHGFLVLVSDESWISPLSAYLTSEFTKKWLDHSAERRGDRWVINEQTLKWIPVPKPLLSALGVPTDESPPSEHPVPFELPPEWERWATEVSHNPIQVKEALASLERNSPESIQIQAEIFTRAARALDYLSSGQNRLFSLVTPDGKIRWGQLLDILPKGECSPISSHPRLRLTGTLPPHLAIERIDRVKTPTPGILLVTETGFNLHLGSDSPFLLNMLWDQLDGVKHPTWSELLQYLKLPRRLELAESTALDILRSHEEQLSKLRAIRELLFSCQLY